MKYLQSQFCCQINRHTQLDAFALLREIRYARICLGNCAREIP